jgi:hypothetical protein
MLSLEILFIWGDVYLKQTVAQDNDLVEDSTINDAQMVLCQQYGADPLNIQTLMEQSSV